MDNIIMGSGEIGWSGMGWTDQARDRDQWWALVNTAINLMVPYIVEFSNSCTTGGFSKRAKFHEVIHTPIQDT
jgi:hypothetical protein